MSIRELEGAFQVDNKTRILIHSSLGDQVFQDARFLQKKIHEEIGLRIPILKGEKTRFHEIYLEKIGKDSPSWRKIRALSEKIRSEEESYLLTVLPERILIQAVHEQGMFYGMMTLLKLIKEMKFILPCMEIADGPYFIHRGFYHDVTRGKVPTMDTLKELIDFLAEYKVNELQLYVEHTYLFEGFSEVWRNKDALSSQDILELDHYCKERHIELIPSLSTFGHLYELLRTRQYSHLSELPSDPEEPYSFVNRMAHFTLDVSNEESIEVVRKLIEEFIPLFSSRKFNICADETFDLGKGKNKMIAEEVGEGRLYVDFLKKIIGIVAENGKEVMFWGDIILKHPELLSELPKDLVCLNWGYSMNETEDNTRIIAESGIRQYVCPSTTGWNRMINWYENSSVNIRKMITYAKKYNAYGILNTDWGDHGHVNLLGSSKPMMVYAADLSWNPFDMIEDDVINDRNLSMSLYGIEHPELMGILRKISKEQIANWSYINFHLEKDIVEYGILDKYPSIMKALDHVKIRESYFSLKGLKKELLTFGGSLKGSARQDYQEFLVMTDLMSLTQEVFLFFMKYDMGVEGVELTRDRYEIADNIEYAMEEYKSAWRARNRESELSRILDKFYLMADKLRTC